MNTNLWQTQLRTEVQKLCFRAKLFNAFSMSASWIKRINATGAMKDEPLSWHWLRFTLTCWLQTLDASCAALPPRAQEILIACVHAQVRLPKPSCRASKKYWAWNYSRSMRMLDLVTTRIVHWPIAFRWWPRSVSRPEVATDHTRKFKIRMYNRADRF